MTCVCCGAEIPAEGTLLCWECEHDCKRALQNAHGRRGAVPDVFRCGLSHPASGAGAEYDEAIDVDGTPYTYTETDKLVTDNFDIETASPEQLRERLTDTETAAKILLGERTA